MREKLKPRAKVERKISEVMGLHRMRQGRYFGQQKTDHQQMITVTMVNTKRLITLATEDPKKLAKRSENRWLHEYKRGPRCLDLGLWSLIRPTTAVCSLAPGGALGPYCSTVTVFPVICKSAQVELLVSSLSRNRSVPSAEFPSAVTRNL